jgi:hypothetical protein
MADMNDDEYGDEDVIGISRSRFLVTVGFKTGCFFAKKVSSDVEDESSSLCFLFPSIFDSFLKKNQCSKKF